MIRSNWLKKLLGVERISRLAAALKSEHHENVLPILGNIPLLAAVVIALLPAATWYLRALPQTVDLPTVVVGIATCLAILLRKRSGISFNQVHSWKQSLELTHTAFALGCIPTLLLMLASPEALYTLAESGQKAAIGPPPTKIQLLGFVAQVALWAAVTEEFIFRGLVVSVARRWRGFKTQRSRDFFAIFLSAAIFGAGHLNTWGPAMSIALTGIGAGLAVAYIANGERLVPIIIYHAAFDMLSLSFAFVGHKT